MVRRDYLNKNFSWWLFHPLVKHFQRENIFYFSTGVDTSLIISTRYHLTFYFSLLERKWVHRNTQKVIRGRHHSAYIPHTHTLTWWCWKGHLFRIQVPFFSLSLSNLLPVTRSSITIRSLFSYMCVCSIFPCMASMDISREKRRRIYTWFQGGSTLFSLAWAYNLLPPHTKKIKCLEPEKKYIVLMEFPLPRKDLKK
jgi:hypothetical protein